MPLSLLESLREKRNPWLIVAIVMGTTVLVVGSIAWYTLREQPALFADTSQPGGSPGDSTSTDSAGGKDAAPPPPPIYVHVAGAVVAPGVYKLLDGQRVVDAIAAAGGGTADAALNAINLAEALTDGRRLYVPTRREVQGTQPGATYTGGKPFTPPGTSGPAAGGQLVVNVNTATVDELDRISGIGPVLAQRIVLYRAANGPFKAIEDLTKVSGIGDKKLQDLRPYLTIR